MQIFGLQSSQFMTANSGQQAARISAGESMIGTFSTRTEIDTIELNLTAGATYRIELAPADNTSASVYDPKISGLFGPNGSSLGLFDNDSGAGNNALLVYTPSVSGIFQLKVTPQSQSSPIGNYRVTVSEMGNLTDDYTEGIETVSKIGLGESITGTIETSDDKDTIAVTLETGKAYSITLNGDDAGKLGDLDSGKITGFFNENGNAVDENSYRILSGSVGEQLEFTPDTAGVFYVSVGGNGTTTGDYYLSLSEAGRGVDAFQETHIVPKSGDNNIDGLLDFDRAWGIGGTSEEFVITYSFPTASSEFSRVIYGLASEPNIGFSPVTEAEKDVFRGFLEQVTNATNAQFVEVPDTGSEAGTIRLAWSSMQLWAGTRPAFGWAHLPDNAIWSGDMWLNRSMHPGGVAANQTIVHELGHALGLSHANRDVAVDAQYSGWEYSIMTSFKTSVQFPSAVTTDLSAQSFMWLDIQALIHIYGKGDATTGADSFNFNTSSRYFQTIWDAGGTDEIIITGSANTVIDLTPGSWIDVGTTLRFKDSNGTQVGTREATIFIAPDTIIENVDGGGGNDRLTGNDAANELRGNTGHDIISGGVGNDLISGDSGSDTLRGNAGNDSLFAGSMDNDADYVDGGTGDDVVGGGVGNDTLVGGTGKDTMYGGSGDDIIITGRFNDTDSDGFASLDETVTTNISNDVIWSGSGSDSIRGAGGHDIIGGGDDSDHILSYGGNDVIYGGKDSGNDTIDAGDGNDAIFSGAGDDSLLGGNGNDLIFNGAGADEVKGGTGNDTLYAGPGVDTLSGGTGSDQFEVFSGNGSDVISDFDLNADIIAINDMAGFNSLSDIITATTSNTINGDAGILIAFDQDNSLFLTGLTTDDTASMNIIFT